MAELIEKVARLAGWKRGYLYNTPVFCNSTGDPLVYDDAIESLGLRTLLDELLRAGWLLAFDEGVSFPYYMDVILDENTNAPRPLHVCADTLEEAVMLAYIAMKEGNNG